LAVTHHYLGDFESARQYATRGLQIWRSGSVKSPVEEVYAPPVTCLIYKALTEWHFGELASCQSAMADAILVAKELNDVHALAHALWGAATVTHYERNPAEVDRLASDLIRCGSNREEPLLQPAKTRNCDAWRVQSNHFRQYN
jgi:hypothetical protein